MEGVAFCVSRYARGESQHYSMLNISMRAFQRFQITQLLNQDQCVLMVRDARFKKKLNLWERIVKLTADLITAGKICLEHMRLQVVKRLPPLGAEQVMFVLLHPVTKYFYKRVFTSLPNSAHEEALTALRAAHQEIYKSLQGCSDGEVGGLTNEEFGDLMMGDGTEGEDVKVEAVEDDEVEGANVEANADEDEGFDFGELDYLYESGDEEGLKEKVEGMDKVAEDIVNE